MYTGDNRLLTWQRTQVTIEVYEQTDCCKVFVMIAVFCLTVLLALIANIYEVGTNTPDHEETTRGIHSVISSIKTRNQQARERTEHFITHCGAELLEIVQQVGIVGDMPTIVKACNKETAEKWTQIHGSFDADIKWAIPAAQQTINTWFSRLPSSTQQSPLAEYYLVELMNLVPNTVLKTKQVVKAKEDESMADLNQNLYRMLRLNVVALEDMDNLSVYQTMFETQYSTACALTKISSDNLYSENDALLSAAAQRAVMLMRATEAIDI